MHRNIVQYNGFAVEVIYVRVAKGLKLLKGYYLDTGIQLDAFELRDIERREHHYGVND